MSKYQLDKALWTCIRDREQLMRHAQAPDEFAAGFDLDDAERKALVNADVRGLYAAGAIPFLVYQFALMRNRGVSMEFLQQYAAALQGVPSQDITT